MTKTWVGMARGGRKSIARMRDERTFAAAVVECGATTAPRVDASRAVALRGEVAGELNVAACAGRVFLRRGEELLAFQKGREADEVGQGIGLLWPLCTLPAAAVDPHVDARALREL